MARASRKYAFKVETTIGSIDGIANCWRNVEGKFAVVVGYNPIGAIPINVISPDKNTSAPQYGGGAVSFTDTLTQLIDPGAPETTITLGATGQIADTVTRPIFPQKFLVPPGCYCQTGGGVGVRMQVFYCESETAAAELL